MIKYFINKFKSLFNKDVELKQKEKPKMLHDEFEIVNEYNTIDSEYVIMDIGEMEISLNGEVIYEDVIQYSSIKIEKETIDYGINSGVHKIKYSKLTNKIIISIRNEIDLNEGDYDVLLKFNVYSTSSNKLIKRCYIVITNGKINKNTITTNNVKMEIVDIKND